MTHTFQPFSKAHTHFKTIGSTNRYALDRPDEWTHGSVFTADLQTAGRGRLGRQWITPPGRALLMTLALKPNGPLERLNQLVMIAGVAAVESITRLSRCAVALKWPNDLIIDHGNGAIGKLGGILVETAFHGDQIVAAVGMGINVNLTQEELPDGHTPPTSILIETGRETDRDALRKQIINRFEQIATADHDIVQMWSKYLHTLGRDVSVTPAAGGQVWHGRAMRVTQNGHLVVKTDSGFEKTVEAGDVTLRIA